MKHEQVLVCAGVRCREIPEPERVRHTLPGKVSGSWTCAACCEAWRLYLASLCTPRTPVEPWDGNGPGEGEKAIPERSCEVPAHEKEQVP